MTFKRTLFSVALAAGAAVSAPAFSQIYVGASLGNSDAKGFCDTHLTGNCDKTGSAWRVFAGYGITRNFAAEVAFIDLGKINATDGTTTVRSQSRGGELIGVFSYPVDRLSLFAKAGGYYAGTKISIETPTGQQRPSEAKGGLTYGLGLQYDFARNFGVRGDWQRYAKVGTEQATTSDVDVFLIGLVWTLR